MSKKNLWLIGAGGMAQAYAKVLNAMKLEYKVIGRGESSASIFKANIGIDVYLDGLEKALLDSEIENPTDAIVAVNAEQLYGSVKLLLEFGVKNILVEKPGALDWTEFLLLKELASQRNANVVIGYNRRFYASVLKAKEIIKADGGVQSFYFEFTEWGDKISPLKKPFSVKSKWFLANSTHVVDLAFYLGGAPKEISTYTSGGLSWHPSSSVFVGAGISDSGALFSYRANWDSAGRWAVHVETAYRRLIFSPLEKLQAQNKGEVGVSYIDINDQLDLDYKPGLYVQVAKFFKKDNSDMCFIEDQQNLSQTYEKIAGYQD